MRNGQISTKNQSIVTTQRGSHKKHIVLEERRKESNYELHKRTD